MIKDARLKAFAAVAERGSFTLAARDLGISQAAVSQNIAELEKDLGAVLFIRSRGSVRLTPAGESFRLYAGRLLHWYAAAESMFSAESGPFSRLHPLCVAADDLAAVRLMPAVTAALRGALPDISVRLLGDGEGECDVRIVSRHRGEGLTLEGGTTLAGVVNACAVTRADSASASSEEAPLAVWAPYSPYLTADMAARVVFESDRIGAVCAFSAAATDGTVGLVPACGGNSGKQEGLRTAVLHLPDLQSDIHFIPSESFAAQPLCSRLRQLVELVLTSARPSRC